MPCWWQLEHMDYGEVARVILSSNLYTEWINIQMTVTQMQISPSIWIASSATCVAISELYKITAAQSWTVNKQWIPRYTGNIGNKAVLLIFHNKHNAAQNGDGAITICSTNQLKLWLGNKLN